VVAEGTRDTHRLNPPKGYGSTCQIWAVWEVLKHTRLKESKFNTEEAQFENQVIGSLLENNF
jgi:hypothetical protein